MRIWIMIPMLALLCLLTGCSGGGGGGTPMTVDSALVGYWMDVAPPQAADPAPGDEGYWPTSCLTVHGNNEYRFEEGSLQNWESGVYTARDGHITFTRKDGKGDVRFLTSANYSFLDSFLIISGDLSGGGTRSFKFALISTASPPPVLLNEWLIARRFSSQNVEQPFRESARFIVVSTGAVTMYRYNLTSNTMTTSTGALLLTSTRHLGMRLSTGSSEPTRLLLLGEAGVSQQNVLVLTAPDGTNTYCVPPAVADSHLFGRWVSPVQGSTKTLTLTETGTFTITQNDQEITGTYRAFLSRYLCFLYQGQQHTIAWDLYGSPPRTLVLGEWDATDPEAPVFRELNWILSE